MNANELMIGNYISVQYTPHDYNKIQAINYNSITGWYIHCENVKPGLLIEHNGMSLINGIAITNQWLLDFGFAEEINNFYRKDQNDFIEIYFDNKQIIIQTQNIFLYHIRYVHELQNLYFVLTGTHLDKN